MAYASTSLCCISGCIESRRASRLKSVISDVSGTGADLHVLIMGNLETKSWRNVIKVQFADIPHVAVHAVTNSPAKISELLGILYKQRPNVVVAIGGGAVMDAAKAAAALYRRDDQRRSPWTCCDVLAATEQRQDGVGIPVIAVPTTPGTGAEVTPNASIWEQ